GSDSANYSSASDGVNVDLTILGQHAIGADQGTDTLVSIEIVNGSPYNDTLTGDSNDNTLNGAAGDDTLNGGGGNDTAGYLAASSGVTVDLNEVESQDVGGGLGSDTLSSIENLIGSNHNDTLIGDANNNVLRGGAGGNDTLIGNGGNDTLIANTGDDVLSGGSGNDTLDGGVGSDTASYADAG